MNKDILFVSIQKQNSEKDNILRAPPLGQLQLCSFLIESGFLPSIIDLGENDIGLTKKVLKKISDEQPKIIGFSISTPLFDPVVSLARIIKRRFPKILIIAGGPHPTLRPIETVQAGCFDIVIKGEGEIPLLKIMKLQKSQDSEFKEQLSSIPGLVYKYGGKSKSTGDGEIIKNLDELPLPARSLINISDYVPLPNQYRRLPVVHIVTSRGCPFGCKFCSNIFGLKLRQRSVDKVIYEINHCIEKYHAKEIYFYDDTLTADKKWIKSLCKRMIDEKFNISWSCFARIDTVDPEMLRLMKRAGCWNIFYGIEAGYQACLDRIFKNITLARIRNTINITNEAGIEIRASFMLGFPWESPREGLKTIKFAKSLDIDYAQFNLFTPFPGIPLYDLAKKSGKLDDNNKLYDLWSPSYVPKKYKTKKNLVAIQKKGFRQFYLRPSHILKMIKKIRSIDDLKRHAEGAIFLFRNN